LPTINDLKIAISKSAREIRCDRVTTFRVAAGQHQNQRILGIDTLYNVIDHHLDSMNLFLK